MDIVRHSLQWNAAGRFLAGVTHSPNPEHAERDAQSSDHPQPSQFFHFKCPELSPRTTMLITRGMDASPVPRSVDQTVLKPWLSQEGLRHRQSYLGSSVPTHPHLRWILQVRSRPLRDRGG